LICRETTANQITKPSAKTLSILHIFIYRRRRLGFPGFHQESLEKNPKNPVNPVKRSKIKIESIPF
jgi:hypothetical protein